MDPDFKNKYKVNDDKHQMTCALHRILAEMYTGNKQKGFQVLMTEGEKKLFCPDDMKNVGVKQLIDYYIETLTKEIGSPEHKGFDNAIFKGIKNEDDKESYYQGTCANILEKQFRIFTIKTL